MSNAAPLFHFCFRELMQVLNETGDVVFQRLRFGCGCVFETRRFQTVWVRRHGCFRHYPFAEDQWSKGNVATTAGDEKISVRKAPPEAKPDVR